MSNYAISLKRTGLLLAALTFTALLLVVNFASFFGKANAAQLTSRSLSLSSSLAGNEGNTTPGGSETNGGDVEYTFTFTPSTSVIGSVLFKVCTTALGACTAPTMDSTNLMFDAATLDSTTLAEDTEPWAADGSDLSAVDAECTGTDGQENCFAITNADPHAQAGTSVSVVIAGVENPLVIDAFYVRIQTFDDDAYTNAVDDGTVASAITEGIQITARVAETLGFSVTGEIDDLATNVPAPTASCVPVTGSGAITLGDPDNENTLALNAAYDNYSVFRLYTNAAGGVSVQYEGDTLRHSNTNDDINPILLGAGTADNSAVGNEQFGLAIDTVIGGTADVDSASRENMNMTNVTTTANLAAGGELLIDAEYAGGSGTIVDDGTAEFAFLTNPDPALRVADEIASTAGYTECKTVAVRYLANISPTTTSGTYTTTIVYSAVPTY